MSAPAILETQPCQDCGHPTAWYNIIDREWHCPFCTAAAVLLPHAATLADLVWVSISLRDANPEPFRSVALHEEAA